MDQLPQLIGILSNFGGLGALCAVLLYLHHSSLKAFREELAAERQTCKESAEAERAQCRELHGETMTKVDGLEDKVDRVREDVSLIRARWVVNGPS